MFTARHTLNKVAEDLEKVRKQVRSATRASVQAANVPIAKAYEDGLRPHDTDEPAVRKVNGSFVPRPHLSQAVGSKVWRYPDGRGYAGIVGTLRGKAPHAHLIENGTKYRFRKKIGGKYAYVEVLIRRGFRPPSVRRTGTAKGYQVLAIAFQRSQAQAVQAFKQKYASKLGS